MRILRDLQGIVSNYRNKSTVHYKRLEGSSAELLGRQGGHTWMQKHFRPILVATFIVACLLSYVSDP